MAKPPHPLKKRDEILRLAVPLFAKSGYYGVSMRDIAGAAGVTPAALYYHFPDKEHLYLDTIGNAFAEKMGTWRTALQSEEEPWVRLEDFLVAFARLLAREKDLQRLIQWVLMDSDVRRVKKLASNVFRELFVAIYDLAAEFGQGYDAHMLAISIIGLIVFPFEAIKASRFMPGHLSRHQNPSVLAKHVVDLLRLGLRSAHGLSDDGITGKNTGPSASRRK